MANNTSWAFQDDLPFHNKRFSALDDDHDDPDADHEILKTAWMIQDELAHDRDYFHCLFEKDPHHRRFVLPLDVASTPPALPPSPPSPPSAINFGRFSQPVAKAKAALETAGVGVGGGGLKSNPLAEDLNGVVSDVSMSNLSLTDSNAGWAHPHLRTPPSVGKELPNSANSSSCSKKTHDKAVACALTAELDSEIDGEKSSLHRNMNSLKRTRVPEQHNKSEKRRRDKINEKMRALHQLIPNSGKTDKSSILDEAIEYMKYLQFQFQYLLMQSGTGPTPFMLFANMQAPNPYYQLPHLQQTGMDTRLSGMDMETMFQPCTGHPLSHMATKQAVHGQMVSPSQQLHQISSLLNATNGYYGIQS